jgi:hypothetical protein
LQDHTVEDSLAIVLRLENIASLARTITFRGATGRVVRPPPVTLTWPVTRARPVTITWSITLARPVTFARPVTLTRSVTLTGLVTLWFVLVVICECDKRQTGLIGKHGRNGYHAIVFNTRGSGAG